MIRSSYAFINLVKATIGVGVFAMPVAFKNAGLWTGLVLSIALGVVNAHSLIKIVRCSQHLCKKLKLKKCANKSKANVVPADDKPREISIITRSDAETSSTWTGIIEKEISEEKRLALDYGEMAAEAFASRRLEPLRIFAIPAMVIANLCVMGLQLGFCSAFYIFVVDHSKEAIDHIFSTNFSRDSLFFIALPFFLFIGSIRNLVILSWIGLMGNVLLVASMGIIVVKMILMEHYPFSQLPSYTSVEGAMLSAGSIVYAFASQGVILPLENKMKKPKEMFGPCGVITTASIVIFLINTVTGFLGYVTYGQELKGSITLNLTNSPLDFTVKIMLLVMTYCGYPIEIYPVVEMLWPYVERYVDSSRKRVVSALQYALQYAAVMVSFGFAYAIPNFKDIIPFIGITSGMMLALILPPVLETVVFLGRWRKGGIIKFLCSVAHNLIYLALGIIFIVVGLYSNYRNLSNADKS